MAYAPISLTLQSALSDKLIDSYFCLGIASHISLLPLLYFCSKDKSLKVLFHFIGAVLIRKIKRRASVSAKLQLLLIP